MKKEAKGNSPLKKMAKLEKRAQGRMFHAAIEKLTAAQQASDERLLAIEEKRLKIEEQMMGQVQSTVALISEFMPQYSQLFYTPILPLQAMPPSSGSQSKDQCDQSKDKSFAS